MSRSRLPHDSGDMGTHMVILGSGTAGTMTANRLQRTYDERDFRITVVDQDDDHVYQPGLLFVPFGLAQPHHLVRSRPQQLNTIINYKQARIERVDLNGRTIYWRWHPAVLRRPCGRHEHPAVAGGDRGTDRSRLGRERLHLLRPAGAVGLRHALERFDGGRVVVDVADLPLKCPVAPLEFAFLADWYFQQRGIRDKVQLAYATPLDAAFTKPVGEGARRAAGGQGHRTGHRVHPRRGRRPRAVGWPRTTNGRCRSTWRSSSRCTVARSTSDAPRASGTSWTSCRQPHTLQHPEHPEVFAIGDASGLPASKAGSVAGFEGEVLVRDDWPASSPGSPWTPPSTGTPTASSRPASTRPCSLTSTTTPNRCPAASLAPSACRCSKESRANHLGKLA